MINVKAKDKKEINEVISIGSGAQTNYSYNLESAFLNVPALTVTTINAKGKKAIPNVFLELLKENLSTPEEGLSNEHGQYQFNLRNVGIHYISARKEGYLPVQKKINFTKGFFERDKQDTNFFNVNIPLIKASKVHDKGKAAIVLSADVSLKGYKL